jgi:hypothetical protein
LSFNKKRNWLVDSVGIMPGPDFMPVLRQGFCGFGRIGGMDCGVIIDALRDGIKRLPVMGCDSIHTLGMYRVFYSFHAPASLPLS